MAALSVLACAAAQAQTAKPAAAQASAAPPAGVVATCAGCHGPQGEGNAAAGFPRLAGQPRDYLLHQLASYADGSRRNQVMEPIAKGLTPQQMLDAAAHYASLHAPHAPATPRPPSDPAAQKRAATLANVGDEKLQVQACANCHGPQGAGEPPVYPYLSGQPGAYTLAALKEWKAGTRDTDPSRQMPQIARALSDQDMAALAQYFERQLPPAPASTQRPSPPAPRRISQPSGPQGTASGAAAQGVGTEQGSPTTGSQGPGGGGATQGTNPQPNR